MTSEQARKLLGGYATNSLTEVERKALFEAALDDQELFDALQQEEALKELLADPASRNQIQQALIDAPVSRPVRAWFSKARLWGGLAGAVAAAVLIVAVIRSNDQPKVQVARVAPSAPTPAPAPAVEPEPKKLESAPRRASSRSPRVLREPANSTTTGALGSVTVQPQATASPPPPPQPAPAAAPQFQAFRQEQSAGADTLLRYSLAKRDASGAYSAFPANVLPQPGDAVRLSVSSALDGSLSLYQLDPSGNWKQIFPAAGQNLRVAPNATATIPDSPIIVTDMEQKFRLTLQPMDGAPLTVDLTIAPGKIP
jgi:Domain of unknown function (DUF4384)